MAQLITQVRMSIPTILNSLGLVQFWKKKKQKKVEFIMYTLRYNNNNR